MKKLNFLRVLERAIMRIMKNIYLFLGVFCALMVAVICPVLAQSTPIYNSPNTNYTGSGPLNLQQIIRGGQGSGVSSGSQYYGGRNARPFGLDNRNFSLGLTPQDIQASRSRRDSEARRREQENLAALRKYDDDLAAFERQQQANSQAQLQQANQGSVSAPIIGTVRRVFNPQSRERFEKPRRVFNSLR